MVICLKQGADLHTAQLMPLPLTVSCFSKIQIGFTFLVLAHLGSPGKGAVKRVCVSLRKTLNLSQISVPVLVILVYKFHLKNWCIVYKIARHTHKTSLDYCVKSKRPFQQTWTSTFKMGEIGTHSILSNSNNDDGRDMGRSNVQAWVWVLLAIRHSDCIHQNVSYNKIT